jgi:hypothetical protein
MIRRNETLTVAWLTSHKEAVCAVLQAHVETGSHAHRHARVQQPDVRAALALSLMLTMGQERRRVGDKGAG